MRFVVVGCGLTGSIVARELADAGHRVTVWDRRGHIAGNMHDRRDDHGIMVHTYGPHVFHTDDEEVWAYMCRFGRWAPFKCVCGAAWDDKYTPTAFNFRAVDTFFPAAEAERIKRKLRERSGGRKSAPITELLADVDSDVRGFAEFLFENDYAPYTAKQWGIGADEIDPSVLERVPVRFSYDECYFTDKHQAMPAESYVAWFERLLSHERIDVSLGVEALDRLRVGDGSLEVFGGDFAGAEVVWTGALDELFGYRFGRLPYRSLRFEWEYLENDSFQPAPVVAYPKAEGYTRIVEYKKLPVQSISGTTIAIEYPQPYEPGSGADPYYPVLIPESKALYLRYRELAESIPGLHVCGRLGDFKYYNMDEAARRALDVSRKIVLAAAESIPGQTLWTPNHQSHLTTDFPCE